MPQEKLIPFQWSGWDLQDALFHSYYDVEFTEDFGEFKAGEKYPSISIDYSNGLVEAYSDDGTEVVKKQSFVAKPI